jgi:small subunit ribosomal protein S4
LGEVLGEQAVPPWLTFDAVDMTGRMMGYPSREEIDLSVNEQLVVEYYSR